jgi:hypothetical protein
MRRDTRCGLPDDYVTHPFTSLKRLKIQQRGLELNAGNQYILVLNLPRVIRTQLGVQQECLAGHLVSIHV